MDISRWESVLNKKYEKVEELEVEIKRLKSEIDTIENHLRPYRTRALRKESPFEEGNVVGLFKTRGKPSSLRGVIVGVNKQGNNWLWRRLRKKDKRPIQKVEEVPRPQAGEQLMKICNTHVEYMRMTVGN